MNRKPSLPMAWLGVLLLGLTLAPLSPAKEIRELDFKTLKSYEAKVQQLARDAIPATVAILNTEGPHRGASGSGVIVDRNGLILTAGHVIQGATELQVIFPDGRGVEAKALGYNLNRDVGMAQITDPGPFPFVKMGKSEDLEPLDIVIALGHAGGFDALRTPPIRIGRVYKTDIMGGFTLTDCTLIGGDSGGPLFDLNGELVGIHSSIGMDLSQNRHAQMDAFERDWDKLKSGNTWGRLGNMFSGDKNPDQPVLGVAMNRDSLVIEDVAPGSPAQKADLQAGDRIVKFEGNRVKNYRHFLNMIGKSSTQDGVDLVVERNGKQLSQTVQLMTRAELFSESKPAPSDDDGEKPGEVARGISGFLEQLFGQNEGRKAPFDLDPDNIDNLLEESGLDELFSGPNNPLEMFKQMGGNPGQMQEMLEEMTIKKDRQEALNKQFEDLVDAHRPAMGDLSESTVRLLHRDRQVALGTVVHANGGVLSKASELAGKQISCLLPNGERAQAEVIKTFPKRDLALLKVVTDEPLKPVTNWSKKRPQIEFPDPDSARRETNR
ncbi:MAG: trypsin-like peptidase domain-containing protein [Verrucomicrobiota bacterium]